MSGCVVLSAAGSLQTCSPSSSSAPSTSPSSSPASSAPSASAEAAVTTVNRWVRRSCTSRRSRGRSIHRPRRDVGCPRARAPAHTAEHAVGIRLPHSPCRCAQRDRVDRRLRAPSLVSKGYATGSLAAADFHLMDVALWLSCSRSSSASCR
jgi:hypothetical protein